MAAGADGAVDLTVLALTQAHARVGSEVGGARLGWLLGVGRSAAVYAGEHGTHGPVAVKILHADVAARDEGRARFARELALTRALAHPGVVRVLDDGEVSGARYAVLERFDGESVEARLARFGARLAWHEVHATLCAALEVVAFLHARGVVHRDLSTRNVLVARRSPPRVTVLDFGVAASRDAPALTRSGHVLGTPAFMAPEIARGEAARATARADVWSLGALAFRMLTGRDVHLARSPAECILFAASHPAPRVAPLAPNVPAAFAHVLDRALAFEPDARYRDAGELQSAWLSSPA